MVGTANSEPAVSAATAAVTRNLRSARWITNPMLAERFDALVGYAWPFGYSNPAMKFAAAFVGPPA